MPIFKIDTANTDILYDVLDVLRCYSGVIVLDLNSDKSYVMAENVEKDVIKLIQGMGAYVNKVSHPDRK